MRLDHPQLSPDVNRSRRVPGGLADLPRTPHHLVQPPADRVPLVRYTNVRNWPHTYTPELAFMVYDEWFSRYVRHENGELEYLG